MKIRLKALLPRLVLLGLLAAALSAPACMPAAPPPEREDREYLRWPPAPEIPRVIYRQSVSGPEELGIRVGLWQRFRRGLLGEEPEPLQMPHGIKSDEAGRLFVVDRLTGGIHIFDPANNRYQNLLAARTGLQSPLDVAVDPDRQRFFVSDGETGAVKIFALDNGRPLGELTGEQIGRPTGLAIHPATEELLVVDTANSSILRFSLVDLALVGRIGGRGEEGGRFNFPVAVAVGPEGRIHVVDSLNHRVQVFGADGQFLLTFGSVGDGPGYFARPKGVAVDSEGNIHVLDALFDNVQIFDGDGRLLMAYGGPGQAPGRFWLPATIFIDGRDRVYVADTYNRRIQIFQFLRGGELP
ncbi:6-bladed beta-propeller [Desulfurivibrio sp. C05AmB]|uniref:6-bladed beta-propeller n=1 Tax=Desulfurivibrio sp. C05AmB TaxID=3374371 RepID=UPI00376EBB0D